MKMKPTFFAAPADFRKWLEQHHTDTGELWVGFYKKGSGKPSITWPESVDAALCFGWIDGIRKSLNEESYVIRFTPRKSKSTWSAVNMNRAVALIKGGLMTEAGLIAYQARRENRSGIYSYEQRSAELVDPYARLLKKNKSANAFFQTQPGSYRKAANWWIVSAKKEETRLKRLEKLVAHSARGQRIPEFAVSRIARKKT
jgi:uncharacterized protein YdeI (YjbR/CyaY-like superfamily)